MDMDFFFTLFGDLPKQGPGSEASTLRALHAVPHYKDLASILDVGCGTGRHSITLARHTPARITALEFLDQQIETLTRNVRASDVADRIDIVKGSMDDLSFALKPFDLIWSESSIYNVGFEKGIAYWKKHLIDKGCVAVSEAVWLTDAPADEIKDFWNEMYPAITSVDAIKATIKRCGYRLLDHFVMPKSDWQDGFYDILEQKVARYAKEDLTEAQREVLDRTATEIAMFKKYSDHYGYAFFIMRS